VILVTGPATRHPARPEQHDQRPRRRHEQRHRGRHQGQWRHRRHADHLHVGVGVGNSTGQAIEFDNGGTLNVLLESVTSSGAARASIFRSSPAPATTSLCRA